MSAAAEDHVDEFLGPALEPSAIAVRRQDRVGNPSADVGQGEPGDWTHERSEIPLKYLSLLGRSWNTGIIASRYLTRLRRLFLA